MPCSLHCQGSLGTTSSPAGGVHAMLGDAYDTGHVLTWVLLSGWQEPHPTFLLAMHLCVTGTALDACWLVSLFLK